MTSPSSDAANAITSSSGAVMGPPPVPANMGGAATATPSAGPSANNSAGEDLKLNLLGGGWGRRVKSGNLGARNKNDGEKEIRIKEVYRL